MEKSKYIAPCRTIYLGETPLSVAMLANGDYRLSQKEVASAIALEPDSINQLLESEYFKALSDQILESDFSEEPLWIEGSNKPIKPISIELTCLYWQNYALAGNQKAQGLVVAMVQHSLQKQSIPETPTLRELKLRIRLAELESELEREKARIQKRQLEKAYNLEACEDYEWEGLKFTTWDQVEQFIEENFGEEASKWIPLEVCGEILIVPWSEFQAELN